MEEEFKDGNGRQVRYLERWIRSDDLLLYCEIHL